ncbi:hypothetical protein B0H15DRAFT_950288 [Mycena belliarum]|uniref:Uncharacterized protein n=1 Tax=Mycena belliarum TaxID=1033014 RepID=A0AAD6XLE5_9AGAR|nr:hypothetical protein B0H15DRAFT_950288 [Mycena belliae]
MLLPAPLRSHTRSNACGDSKRRSMYPLLQPCPAVRRSQLAAYQNGPIPDSGFPEQKRCETVSAVLNSKRCSNIPAGFPARSHERRAAVTTLLPRTLPPPPPHRARSSSLAACHAPAWADTASGFRANSRERRPAVQMSTHAPAAASSPHPHRRRRPVHIGCARSILACPPARSRPRRCGRLTRPCHRPRARLDGDLVPPRPCRRHSTPHRPLRADLARSTYLVVVGPLE